jgi:methionyl-tRNA synthetase
MAQPFIPASAGKLLDLLGIPANERSFDRTGKTDKRIAAGTALPPPAPVFPRYVEPEAAKA